MNYATIKYEDISNGTGIRTSLFVSGCTHGCKGCFNREAWSFNFGEKFDRDVQKEIFKSLQPRYIAGLSLLGGEPMELQNQEALLPFLKEVKTLYPDKTIWCYTGYLFDSDFQEGGVAYSEVTSQILELIDVMVDGKFIQEQYDISLRFKGSYNQRIIDVPMSLNTEEIVIWDDGLR